MSKKVLFQAVQMVKSFGPTKAVNKVDFTIHTGEIRGLIGENGSGKSTICSMFAGILKPDEGEMTFEGVSYRPTSLRDGQAHGIDILLQETGTINELTVAENIFLGKEEQFMTRGILDRKKMMAASDQILSEIGCAIRSDEPIENYSFEDRKLIEVARVMYNHPKILVIDETTTALSQKGRAKIYEIMRLLASQGNAIIFVTHDMKELMENCHTITVFRDGEHVKTLENRNVTEDEIRQLMIGRDLTGHYYRDPEKSYCQDKVVLDVNEITFGKEVRDVSFQLHRGEILGIGGLTDCGMHRLGQLLFGVEKSDWGTIEVVGFGKINSNVSAIEAGIGYIPKDRDTESIFLSSSIKNNIVIASLERLTEFGFLSDRKETALAKKQSDYLSIKMQNLDQLVKDLR